MKSSTDSGEAIFYLFAGVLLALTAEYYILTDFKSHFLLMEENSKWQILIIKAIDQGGMLFRAFFLLMVFAVSLVERNFLYIKISKRIPFYTKLIVTILLCLGMYTIFTIRSYPEEAITYIYPIALLLIVTMMPLLVMSSKFKSKQQFGFKQERSLRNNKDSINLKTRKGWINVVNPFRGTLITGSSGSGKTYSLVNQFIEQFINKGYTGLVYDFKFPALTEVVHKALYNSKLNNLKCYIINFEDLLKSHRVNPLHPDKMPVLAFAEEYAKTIIQNLEPFSTKRMDFFDLSAKNWLTAIIWFYKKMHPEYCTLPHMVNTVLYKDFNHVVSMLEHQEQCADMIRSIATAIKNKAEKQTAGVIASLQVQLAKINSPEIAWVLSGNDFNLDLNNPKDPKILCIGSDPSLTEALSPVIASIISMALKLMNRPWLTRFVLCH